MKFIHLPAGCNEVAQQWQAGRGEEAVLLLPGQVLLTETIARPAAVKTSRQIRQWLLANPQLCQWDPQKETLLRVGCCGDRLFYWAVETSLWQCWKKWLRQHKGSVNVIPDWMLLPAPVGQQFFALQADDTILFRHDEWCGGALAQDKRPLVEAMQPRWLSMPDSGGDYPVTERFLALQVARGSWRLPESLLIPVLQRVLPTLLLLCMAFMVEQAAELTWLSVTRAPVDAEQELVLTSDNGPQGMSQALWWLQQIQYLGPVQLSSLILSQDSVSFLLSTPLSCGEMRSRLKPLPLRSSFNKVNAGCEISLQGVLR